MKKILDLRNQKFTRLRVLEEVEPLIYSNRGKERKTRRWLCECDCGNKKRVNQSDLRSGKTVSCGCLRNEKLIKRRKTHGMANKVPEYYIWQSIKDRCKNRNSTSWNNYGKREISICESWVNNFEKFYKDIGERPSKKHSIERIDINGNYEPSNCCWATKSQQATNIHETKYRRFVAQIQRNNKHYYIGSYKTIIEAANAVEEFKNKLNP